MCIALSVGAGLAKAGEVYYDVGAGVTDLSAASAWVGGAAPTVDDVAVLSETGGDFTLGAAVSWKGLILSNLTANVTISGEALTLGEGGISPGGPVSPNFFAYFECPIVITCDQSWYSVANQAICINGGISGNGTLTTRNYPNVGNGQFVFKSFIDVPWNARATEMQLVANGAAVSGDVSVGWGHKLIVRPSAGATNTPAGTEKPFSSFFHTGRVVNDGLVYFHLEGNNYDVFSNVRFDPSDSIVGNESLTQPIDKIVDNIGTVRSMGRFRMTGGVISNSCVLLDGGDFIVEGGSVWARKNVSDAARNDRGQRFLVNGASASVDAESLELGFTNKETIPNWFVLSNGTVRVRDTVQLTRMTLPSRGSNTRLDVAGGTFEAGGVKFGDAVDGLVTNSFVTLNVTGGELGVGEKGLVLGSDSWTAGLADEVQDGAWYKVWLSGGRYRAFASHSNTVAVAMEGEREIRVEGGVKMEQMGMMSGAASLTKTGAGTLVLPQVCAWTGTTTVAEGTLASSGGSAPVPFIAFKADDLALSDGDTVEEWQSISSDGTRTNAFTKSISQGVNIPALPKYRTNRIGGHAAVVFNGVNEGLAMTGGQNDNSSNTSPTFNASRLTVGVVFRAASSSAGGTNDIAFGAGGIVSQCYGNWNSRWSLSVTTNGIVGSGVRPSGDASGTTVWSDRPSVFDGKPHVAFYSWTAGDKVRINLDGAWTEVADTSGAQHISRNRMLIGVGEHLNGGNLRYFGGEIAEIRIYKDQALSDDEVDAIGLGLAMEYGASYLPSGTIAAPAPVESVSLPDPSGLWRADDLAQSAGQEVTEWTDAVPGNNQAFTKSIASSVAGENDESIAAPTISPDLMNGHKAIRFDAARKSALALTGNNNNGARYLGTGKNFTVALVVRPFGVTASSAGLFGQSFVKNDSQNKWRIGISGNKGLTPCDRVGLVLRDGASTTVSTMGRPRFVCDARPHVFICSIGTNVTVNVDGVRSTRRGATQLARQLNVRTTLGFLEKLPGVVESVNFFSGDVAEIRFYADTTLSVAQQNALGRELAAKYGADMGGFCAEEETMFASPRVTVASGATLYGIGDGFRVPSGTVLGGEGRLLGQIVVDAGGVLDTTAGMQTADAQLVFAPGGILRIGAGANGKTVPLHVVRVVGPSSGGPVIDLTDAGKTPTGTVLSWDDGEAPDVTGWTVLGGNRTTALSVDAEQKCVNVKTQTGCVIMFR
ncbi:MAG: hypothetical protein IJI36_09405 [Kiritimatiellae bacterium]|nr:hypothetical protein [Kiritimatiellia bacterium]